MATGKGKIERYTRIYLGGYDLSGDARTFASLDNAFDEVNFTAWSSTVKEYVGGGYRAAGIRGFQAFVNDDTGRSFDNMKDSAATEPVSVLFGSNAVPAAANTAYLLPAVQIGASVNFSGGAATITGDFAIDGSAASSGKNPLGYVLMPSTSISSTTNGTSVDTGSVTTTDGYSANLHILATASGDFAFKIEMSIDNSSWSTLGTFTITGNAVASEHMSGSGNVNRYIRFVATRTAGTVTAVCTFARNSAVAPA